MPVRPNFTHAQLVDDKVRVEGTSDEEDLPDIVDIRVVLVQGNRITAGNVERILTDWSADLPASDPTSGDFEVGQAVAFGWQTHSENFLTMTWTEPVDIR
jgi:hypothetical protein